MLLPFNVLVIMTYYNYYLSVTTDPGKIPSNWEPPSSLVMSKEITSEGITGPRYCKTCKVYKPPRSHHCRYCKRCVLKMDHHCPWINNCVGYDNHGHFVRFIIYAVVACSYVIALLIGRVRAIMEAIRHFQFDAEPNTLQIIFMVLNFVLAFIVVFCVGILTVYQLYCLSRNQSNIEAWERSKVEGLIRRGKILPIQYPFDLGIYRNLCEVLGPQPLTWLWPKPMQGDGLSFPVTLGTDPRLPYYWPPRDPDDLRPSIFSSKYKRQQETQRLLAQDPNAVISEDESEGYYDSGSFVSDSDADYSIDDEEEGVRRFVSHSVYDLSGTSCAEHKQQYNRRTYHREDQDTEEEEDSIPLSTLATRKKMPSSKED
ncbi:Palmitoyltransferase [Rhizopus stolonifer]|uniref:Palmitoyltransferase n=2 Tax=Mucorineae TaxID=1344963 RepID=A0A367IYB1_RHIST|nr:Palmitoyltransferase [Rhizopus stolonifer]